MAGMGNAPTTAAELKRIGARIRDRRLDQRIRQAPFAQRVGITTRWLYEIENGRDSASELTYRKIADALDVPLSTLLNGKTGGQS